MALEQSRTCQTGVAVGVDSTLKTCLADFGSTFSRFIKRRLHFLSPLRVFYSSASPQIERGLYPDLVWLLWRESGMEKTAVKHGELMWLGPFLKCNFWIKNGVEILLWSSSIIFTIIEARVFHKHVFYCFFRKIAGQICYRFPFYFWCWVFWCRVYSAIKYEHGMAVMSKGFTNIDIFY